MIYLIFMKNLKKLCKKITKFILLLDANSLLMWALYLVLSIWYLIFTRECHILAGESKKIFLCNCFYFYHWKHFVMYVLSKKLFLVIFRRFWLKIADFVKFRPKYLDQQIFLRHVVCGSWLKIQSSQTYIWDI